MHGLIAALALGADAIAMGSRLALTQESPVHHTTKDMIRQRSVGDTIYSRNFDGLWCRVMDTPTARKFLGIIEREAQRLHALVSDLMSLSRVEAEKHDLPTERIDLASLVERAARDAAGPARLDRLMLDITAEPVVLGDLQQVEQVVRNLVDNALKYGAPDTPVNVVLDLAQGDLARIAVADQGEGIAPEQIPHLTRRFYRTDPGRSRASGGTGLGLAIVKHIVERHRGRLDITSQLGKGTRVVVRLPLAEFEGNTAAAPETRQLSQ